MLACATCSVQEGEDTAREMQKALNGETLIVFDANYWDGLDQDCAELTKGCAGGGFTIASAIIPTSSAFALASLVPTQTSSAVVTSPEPKLSSVVSISSSAAPTSNATSVAHGNVVLVPGVIAGVALAALAAAILVWWACVRRRRRTRFDLGG